MLLTMGNKNYSSWSLRPWILMKHLEIAFDERVLPLDTPEFSRDIASLSPYQTGAGLATRVAASVGFPGHL
jgi:glutathione S-transferase